eukprot:6308868-Heterocapsa_arctica.AAC.1
MVLHTASSPVLQDLAANVETGAAAPSRTLAMVVPDADLFAVAQGGGPVAGGELLVHAAGRRFASAAVSLLVHAAGCRVAAAVVAWSHLLRAGL